MMDKDVEARFPFLADLSAEGSSRLEKSSRFVELVPNTGVISRGDEISGAYFVISGGLRVYYAHPEGREGTLYWVDPGQSCILALNCLFAGLKYPAWVESDNEDTRVLFVSGDAYRSLFQNEPSVQKFTFETQSSRLLELMVMLEENACFGLEQRVAAYLLKRADDEQILETTHERIASHVGSSREVVSRVLRNLGQSGAVDLKPRQITITDIAKLRSITDV